MRSERSDYDQMPIVIVVPIIAAGLATATVESFLTSTDAVCVSDFDEPSLR